MSSKLNVKAKGKDGRPKSSDRLRKKRDGTPEKSLTPSLEPDDSQTPTRNVIWNEEIQKLQIRQDDLPKAWPPRPPSIERQAPSPVKVPVRKAKKVSDADKPKSRVVSVSKPAPPDAPIKEPNYSGYAGPRYDIEGKVVMHSLLGTYEDFHREACRRGDLTPDGPEPVNDTKPTVKYEKKKRSYDLHSHRDENKALEHWERRMMERKRQQGYISNLLQKAPEDLAMNQGDYYRNVQEKRYLIDRAIPKVDYGKGYRVGSEFWQQQEPFGDDITGLHMSLTQSQRGYPAPLERIGLSKVVKAEKGVEFGRASHTTLNYPWHRSEFLDKRQQELQPFMDEITESKPDFDNLQVIGSNAPYFRTMDEEMEKRDCMKMEKEGYEEGEGGEENEDCEVRDLMGDFNDDAMCGPGMETRNEQDDLDGQEKPVFGPSLLFGGQRARWMGDSFSLKNEVGIEARVTFESLTGDRITSYLELGNNGTTSIYYDWKKMSKENPFELVQAQVQRFYFNNSSGVLLPGETLKFPFVFKSPNAGVFTEQWRLETRPVVCSGAALLVTLRGVALQEDKYKKQREQLEKELVHRQANQVVHHLLYELVSGVRTPTRARSPVDAYITEEEIFNRNNPGLLYNHDIVAQLQQLHQQLYEEQEDAYVNVWGLSVQDLQQSILELEDEDDAKKESFLHQMNDLVRRMTNVPHQPVTTRLEAMGHQLFVEAIDSIVGEAMYLRTQMGLPSKEVDEVDGDMGDSRKGGRAPEKGKPEPAKDKGKGAGGKDAKGGKGKESKADAKGKTTPGPKKAATPVKPAPTPAPTSTSSLGMAATAPSGGGGDKEGGESFSSQPSSPEPGTNSDIDLAATEKLYKETLMSQTYNILGDMIDQMDHLFSATKETHHSNC